MFDDLTEHPDIKDVIKYTGTAGNPAVTSEMTLAQVFGVDRVMVARATRNTAAEDVSASYSFIAGTRNALLVQVARNPGVMVPSGGYTFAWNAGDRTAGVEGVRVYPEDKIESDWVESGFWFDHKVVSAAMGVFFSNAVAA